MKEGGNFYMVFEKNDSRLPRKTKVWNHYEQREAPVEFVSKVKKYC